LHLIAVLDANVLFPMVLRDALLRAAATGCFRLHWSARILDEVAHSLVDDRRMDAARAAALRTLMEEAFPDANVDDWERLEPKMGNHPKDRHVAAAAASIGAGFIVTSNIRHFTALPAGIIAMTPDQFLSELLTVRPDELMAALEMQAAGYRRPPLSVAGLVEQLGGVAPDFAARALVMFGSPGTETRSKPTTD
jgi:predicted nucleic acid-binding protein